MTRPVRPVHSSSPRFAADVLPAGSMAADLRDALAEDRLTVHYQPIVNLRDGRAIGVEALLRWPGGPGPAEFVPVAEETGLIVQLGDFVVRRVCEQLRAWDRAGLAPISAAVNVSAGQLRGPEVAATVLQACLDTGVEPQRLCLEVTETAFVDPDRMMAAGLQTLKSHGVFLAIDDFGVGYSSLGRLKRLPVEVLKIDRSFVDGLGSDADDSAIVAAILSLAHVMGLNVVAEGVETGEQAGELLALGCEAAQGWRFAKAMPPEELPAFLARSGGWRPAWRRRRGRADGARPRSRAQRSLIREMMHQIGIAVEGEQ